MNLYIHFPFCRSKCAYCALHSYVGRSEEERRNYVTRIVRDLEHLLTPSPSHPLTFSPPLLSTLYFGGGTPALCDLQPILDFLAPYLVRTAVTSTALPPSQPLNPSTPQFSPPHLLTPHPLPEFTVELNPLDVTPKLLHQLKNGGVNRLSMGVQSFDDAVLRAMGRPHTAAQARDAWTMIRDAGFDNAGIDLICGWPSPNPSTSQPLNLSTSWQHTLDEVIQLAPEHCSVYTLILEPKTRLARDVELERVQLPSDDVALAELAAAERALASIGLERYEISSFAKPGKECRHNLATWRGEDYIGIGDGACSREGNAVSRVIFRLRLLKEGFSPVQAAADFPELASRVAEWTTTLDRFVAEGLLTISAGPSCGRDKHGPPFFSTLNPQPSTHYHLTPRGAEVCDSVLAALV